MNKYRNLHLIILLTVSFLSYSSLYAQEDISVEFSFKKPNEFVCEIRNTTDYNMIILLNKEEAEQHSNLYFDIRKNKNDSSRYVYYGLMKDVNNQKQTLNLNSGECYAISYKVHNSEMFMKAKVFVKYIVKSSPSRFENYRKIFDLNEIRSKEYTQHVLKEEEEKTNLPDLMIKN